MKKPPLTCWDKLPTTPWRHRKKVQQGELRTTYSHFFNPQSEMWRCRLSFSKLHSACVPVLPLCLIGSWNLTRGDVLEKRSQRRILKHSVSDSVDSVAQCRASFKAREAEEAKWLLNIKLGCTVVFEWPLMYFDLNFSVLWFVVRDVLVRLLWDSSIDLYGAIFTHALLPTQHRVSSSPLKFAAAPPAAAPPQCKMQTHFFFLHC